MASAPRPTLRSLAAEAGVSATTMSFALRGSPEISDATRERLQRLARARGYRINPLVSALFSQVRRWKPRGDHAVIAYLNTWWPRRLWETCNTKTGQFRGAAKRAAELGFRLENFWLREPGMTPARLARILRARGIRGVLVGPVQDQRAPLDFPWGDFALATTGYSLHEPAIARASHAHFRGMYRAMDELIARGYRRIGYVTSKDFEGRVNSLWGAAYRYNQHRLNAKNRIEPLEFESEADARGLQRWIAHARPDAVINALPNVFEILAELDLRAPRDLGFAHLDLPTHLKAANVCGIDQLWEIVGACTLELIASQLYTNTCGIPPHPVTQLVEGIWVEGRTLAKAPAGTNEDKPAGRTRAQLAVPE
jgi:LacI family transcriptional regulator